MSLLINNEIMVFAVLVSPFIKNLLKMSIWMSYISKPTVNFFILLQYVVPKIKIFKTKLTCKNRVDYLL